MPSNHLILCRPLLLLPSIFPSIMVFSNELALRIRWPKYWNFIFRISPSNAYSELISFRIDLISLQSKGLSEIKKCDASSFVKIALAIQGLWFFFYYYENCHWNSMKTALNLQMALDSMSILAISVLLIHEHRISFHLFVSSSISFIRILSLLVYKPFTSLITFISKYCIIFNDIVN